MSQQASHWGMIGQYEGLTEQPYVPLPDVHMYGADDAHRRMEWHIAAEHFAEHSKRGVLEH